jgi:hypothetical protein
VLDRLGDAVVSLCFGHHREVHRVDPGLLRRGRGHLNPAGPLHQLRIGSQEHPAERGDFDFGDLLFEGVLAHRWREL